MRTIVLVLILLALPRVTQAQDAHWLHAALAGSMIVHGADISTTMYALGANPQGFREANPVLRQLVHDPVLFAVGKMGLATAVNYYLLRQHVRHPRLTFWASLAQTAVIGYVVHHNAQLIRHTTPVRRD